MAGKKGQKWAEKKAQFPVKINTAVSEKTGKVIEVRAKEEKRSKSSIVRNVLEKLFG